MPQAKRDDITAASAAPSRTNVVSLCNYRAADIATREKIIAAEGAAFPPGKFPGTDFKRISAGVALSARMIRAGLMPTEGIASYLDRLSESAKLACIHVRELERLSK